MYDNQPLVSVMMPVYNGEKTLPLALASLKAQTYTNWKAIIVNDGSTDGTREFLDALDDSRFKVIHLQKNRGRGNARQVALENAEGKYISYLDVDDIYHPQKLELQIDILEQHSDVELVSTGIASFDLEKNIKSIRGLGNNKPTELNNNLIHYPFFPASSMIRLEIAKRYNYNIKLNVGEDNDFFRRYLDNNVIYKMDRVLYYYEEIGAINFKKLIKYQIESIRTYFLIEKVSCSVRLIESIKRFFKIIYYIFITPLYGIDKVIAKRGTKPTESYINEFESIKKRLSD